MKLNSALRATSAAVVIGIVALTGCRQAGDADNTRPDSETSAGSTDTGGNTSGSGSSATTGSGGASGAAGGGTSGANTSGGTGPDTTGTNTGARAESSGGTTTQPNNTER